MVQLKPDLLGLEILKYFEGKQIGDPIEFTLEEFFKNFLKKYQKLRMLFKNSNFLSKSLQEFFQGEKAAKGFFFEQGNRHHSSLVLKTLD